MSYQLTDNELFVIQAAWKEQLILRKHENVQTLHNETIHELKRVKLTAMMGTMRVLFDSQSKIVNKFFT